MREEFSKIGRINNVNHISMSRNIHKFVCLIQSRWDNSISNIHHNPVDKYDAHSNVIKLNVKYYGGFDRI